MYHALVCYIRVLSRTTFMKLSLLFLTFLVVSYSTQAQSLKSTDFIGTWQVTSSRLLTEIEINLDEEGKKKMEMMKNGLVSTTFTFQSNNSFNITFSDNIPPFMKELEFLNNKKWKLNSGNGLISIGTEEDQYSLMGIFIKQEANNTFFLLDESPFLLKVIKK